tara:strand:- start:56 stop:535 length:480 start_codon:yes stop_codon:yes gene_type:complete
MKIAVYPGTFDPITNGHLDIIYRGIDLFDKVFVSVVNSPPKSNLLFSSSERISLIQKSLGNFPSVEVESFDGLMIEHAKRHSANAVIRGLRVLSDFENEFKMALMNRNLNDKISTVFLMTHEKYTHISSSMVREVISLGGDVSKYVPEHVDAALKRKFK